MKPVTRAELSALDDATNPIPPEPFEFSAGELLAYAVAFVAAIAISAVWPWGFA